MQVEEVAKAIINGDFDGQENAIREALIARDAILRATQQAQVDATIEVGSKVRLKGLSPKYINGQEVTIVNPPPGRRASSAKHWVVSDRGIFDRFPAGRPFKVPKHCVELV